MRTLTLILTLAAAASAQTHANSSGVWKQDDSRSTVRPGSTLKYSNKIDQQDQQLTKTTVLEYPDRPPISNTQSYRTDGTPVKSTDREGDQFTTVVKWEGSWLVFEIGESEKKGSLFTRETSMLSEDGKILTKKIHGTGGCGDSDQTFVLVKE